MKIHELSSAQKWFLDHANQTISWSIISETRPRIATQAKGIYKPAENEYALSVKETLKGPYPDKEPVYRKDGSWLYEYYQENPDPLQRDNEYTNRALMACIQDGIPVGVMIQTKPKPGAEYKILGLAYVTGWDEGYFYLESYDETHEFQPGPKAEIEQFTRTCEQVEEKTGSYDPSVIPDSRKKVIGTIVQRRGQAKFREQLIKSYKGQCAITGCDVTSALEAAHITPYKGSDSNTIHNGLLLRADVHTLWDLGLIAVDPDSYRVLLADELIGSCYDEYQNQLITQPEKDSELPFQKALRNHLEWTYIKSNS